MSQARLAILHRGRKLPWTALLFWQVVRIALLVCTAHRLPFRYLLCDLQIMFS